MQECTEFAVRTEALIRAHPEDEFLVIVDENLDVVNKFEIKLLKKYFNPRSKRKMALSRLWLWVG